MKKTKILIALSLLALLAMPFFSANSDYELEVGLPSTPSGTSVGLTSYLQKIYQVALLAVGAAALLMLVVSGIVYMLSDTVFSKEQAKEYIWGAISGLILAFAAYLILYAINPDLIHLDIVIPKLGPNSGGSGW
ncbi:MAG: hypothetical protein CO003_00920 [Candidatus Portnoybacteria bacterium CG_4_8_14_3_um_filter_44_15]|uniref:Uncharacterized protein n=4 Tax=Candidatus Portnoyibacteriota TaxID=1817913 RepID=A0A2M7YLC5_9BACT|nr:MAG: hypothetical protein COX45_01350 [Candidatus Portnoybacteria bacterium CG23_combo_of_CG06-09_8_20_14_all_44_36]PIW74762.1 MAG: hypothetical protein CO003_00920 [Candidatus Portnoybacteria bacterium CG_4_8_14_3_um_filter_44_15]PIZ69609.1 MAG: hypothetical protein COY10_01155 [Candidatus Portnoybacteria bacterium CG_4_10_14_0_2_um_filter_43_36]PJA63795.1 MAG: hypothetical protein CO160_01965 [Candidatus Portnoybacteria bacterium CG_4_9_14_3_um_filter_43_11]PJE59371.1 MAG: hypothetical pro